MIPRSATYVRPDLVQRLGVWRPAAWSTDIYAEAQAIAAAFSQDPRVLYPQFYQDKARSVVAQAVSNARAPQGPSRGLSDAYSPQNQPAFQFGKLEAGGEGVRLFGLGEWGRLPKRSFLRRLITGVW